jgi:tetratricopeptide (TPR) repeat protein
MPGHIFARLGLWQEDIRSNLASAEAARQPALLHTEAQNLIHALEFQQYAYLQIGQDDNAKRVADQAAQVRPGDYSPGFQRYYYYKAAGFPVRQALETRDWATALALRPSVDADVDGQRVIFWAQAVAAGHLRDRTAAKQAETRFRATYDPSQLLAAQTHPSSMWSEIQAWTLFAHGDVYGAITILRPIADHQDKIGKGEVDLPAREMIGDMLRLVGKFRAALDEYRASLQADPGRFNTLLHAGEVAAKLGRNDEASRYYHLLLRNVDHPTPLSKEALRLAYAFLANRPVK